MDRLKNYAALARVSNVATVLTNVWVGAAVASRDGAVSWKRVAVCFLGVAAIYAAGMAMNDLVDEAFDRDHRPHRPLPQGRVSRAEVRWLVLGAFVAGLGLLAVTGWQAVGWGVGLVAVVIGYNVTHKRYRASVLLMGLCRSLVYLTAAAGVAAGSGVALWGGDGPGRVLVAMAGILGLYVVGLSWEARNGALARVGLARRVGTVVFPTTALGLWMVSSPESGVWLVLFGVVIVVWLVAGLNLIVFHEGGPVWVRWVVTTGLAGICLLDAMFLNLWGQDGLSWWAGGCFVVTFLAQRLTPGT